MEKWFAEAYKNFARGFLPWLSELGRKYKESGKYVCYPYVLADCYEDPDDIEIALFSGLLTPSGPKDYKFFNTLQKIMGEHPAQWFNEKGFVMTAVGNDINRKFPDSALQYWRVAQFFRKLYELRHSVYKVNGVEKVSQTLEERITGEAKEHRCTLRDAIIRLFPDIPLEYRYGIVELLIWRLYRRDGFGFGLWGRGDENMPWIWDTPCNRLVREMTGFWSKSGTKTERALLICDNNVDFFYTAQAWKVAKRMEPLKMQHLLRYYTVGMEELIQTRTPNQWYKYLFDIDF